MFCAQPKQQQTNSKQQQMGLNERKRGIKIARQFQSFDTIESIYSESVIEREKRSSWNSNNNNISISSAHQTVWPEKNRQMSIEVAQKWFH